jgi:putative oxidoreductase
VKTFERLVRTDDDVVGLIARLGLGLVIFPHGAQKVLGVWGGHGLPATVDAFQQWFGFPAVVTVLVAAAEFGGALALMLGLASRFVSTAIVLVMAGAVFFVTRGHFFMNWYNQPQYGEGFEFHLLAIALGLIVMVRGGGRYSVDGVLARRWSAAADQGSG